MRQKKDVHNLNATVRKLRNALGDTQQEFADRLGLAVLTVVRYENARIPRGKGLARLEQVASANGFDEFAATFRKALTEEFGSPPLPPASLAIQVRNDEERELVNGLLHVMRWQAPAELKARKALRRLLKPMIKRHRLFKEEDEALEAQRNAIVRLLEKGRPAEDVKKILRTDTATVAEAFFAKGSIVRQEGRVRIRDGFENRVYEIGTMLLKDGWSIKEMVEQFGYENEFRSCAFDLEAWDALDDF